MRTFSHECGAVTWNNSPCLRDLDLMTQTLFLTALAVLSCSAYAGDESAPRQEIGLTLGDLHGLQRNRGLTRFELASGVALEANYGYRLLQTRDAAIYGEVHLLANPQRTVDAGDPMATRDVASLYLTPGIRVKLRPASRIAPYAAVGFGWADYEQSTRTLSGASNGAPRTVNHGALDFGGGVDLRFWRWIGLRAEVRDFYTGGPSFNTVTSRGPQHNVVAGGGLVLRLR